MFANLVATSSLNCFIVEEKPMPQNSKKKKTITALFDRCKKSKKFEFDNDLVKQVSIETDFKNHNDVTKIDQSKLLPEQVKNTGYCIAHLGEGRHRFIREIEVWYHRFEPIKEHEVEPWEYKPSLLNHTDESESNIISFAYNQRIIQHFLYGDITVSPKIYMSRRTKINVSYRVGMEQIAAKILQVELDATFEHNGEVVILEAKNGSPADFAVYQLFHPFLDYYNKNISGIKKITCCYLLKDKSTVCLYLYAFSDADDMGSIYLVKKARYELTVK